MDIITNTCMVCGNAGFVQNVDEDGYNRWKAGEFIQVALPTLSAGDREQLMTGTHDACFNLLFPEDDEDEDEDY